MGISIKPSAYQNLWEYFGKVLVFLIQTETKQDHIINNKKKRNKHFSLECWWYDSNP